MPSATRVHRDRKGNEFLKFLASQSVLREDALAEIEEQAKSEGITPEAFLARRKITDEETLARLKAKFFGLPYADLSAVRLEPAALKIIPKASAENYQVIVFGKEGADLQVGIVDPANFQAMAALDVLASEERVRVRYHVISPSGFRTALKGYEELKGEVAEVVEAARKEIMPKTAAVAEVIKGAPVSRIVSVIMRHALDGNASDIHIEPHGNETRVRYRIDGVLKVTLTLPGDLHASLVARVKVLAGLKLDETRVPQDGRITEIIGGKPIDFRVSTLPLQEGREKVVMRILSTEGAPTLEDLGFNAAHIETIRQIIKKPHGLILISGPTGAGKSTTLYAVLTMLNQEGINIVTLEDPIEYFIAGVNQSQVRPEVGYTFATGLRSILRQDPNVIMVGEIRDTETAELAVHAALTGHLLLSTIHTNDARGVVPRLVDLKVEPFLLAATFNIAIAQRLARRICPHCKEEAQLPQSVMTQMAGLLNDVPPEYLAANAQSGKSLTFYRGKGCPRCGTTGYKGRVAVAEIIVATKSLADLIAAQFPRAEVDKELKSQGMITLMQDALIKALQGLTTVEEVLRISKE